MILWEPRESACFPYFEQSNYYFDYNAEMRFAYMFVYSS